MQQLLLIGQLSHIKVFIFTFAFQILVGVFNVQKLKNIFKNLCCIFITGLPLPEALTTHPGAMNSTTLVEVFTHYITLHIVFCQSTPTKAG